VARALHFAGSRKDKSFIAQNCAALPESILESELFGHVKGAFTHATETRAGILEGAHGGTLFLDEVGDMSLTMQAKLLRFLQEGTFTPVGGRVEKKVDVRVIAATHRDLEAMVKDKTFREDLFYRLAVVPLRTPALRERRDDIPVLAEHFLRKKAAKFGRPAPRLAPETLARLAAHNYPGNVRELENAIEYALNMLGDRTVVLPEDLPDRIQGAPGPAAPSGAVAAMPTAQLPKDLMLDEAVMALEVEWINRAMQASGGNISQSARALGLSRQGLHNKLAKYGIKGDAGSDAG
jgi:DNA-binding NtrC family response regulator